MLNKEDAYKDLDWALANIGRELDSKTQENLFILYYGGHGGFGKDRSTRLWQSSQEDAAESVDWYKLQEKLGGFHFDILFHFDCCYAMAMPTEGIAWRKRCEIVSAAGEREKAGGKPEISFTAALRDQLKEDFENIGETNAWRLGSIMQSRDYKSTLKSTPQHRRLAEGHASNIPLVPVPQCQTHTIDRYIEQQLLYPGRYLDMLRCQNTVQHKDNKSSKGGRVHTFFSCHTECPYQSVTTYNTNMGKDRPSIRRCVS